MAQCVQLPSSNLHSNKLQDIKSPQKCINPLLCTWQSLFLLFAFLCGPASPALTVQHPTKLPHCLL